MREQLVIENNEFILNNAFVNGGAIYNRGKLFIRNKSSFINNFTIHQGGGAIKNDKSLEISDSIFDSNKSARNGGAIHNGRYSFSKG